MRYIQNNLIFGLQRFRTKTLMGLLGFIIASTALLASLVLSGTAFAASTLYVAPVGAGGGSCATPDYNTISAAVTAASSGDVINVCPGAYAENVNVNKSLTLNGAQAGVDVGTRTFGGAGESTVTGTNPSASTAVFTVNAPDVTIDGFSITNTVVTNAAMGVTVNSVGNNALITNNIIDTITSPDPGGQGTAQAVYLQGGPDGVQITDNEMNNIQSVRSAKGVLVGDNGATNAALNTLIEGNTITNVTSVTSGASTARGSYGISVANATVGVTGLQILDNTISTLSGSWVHGIGLEGNTPGAIVSGNSVSNIQDINPTPVNDAAAVFFEANPSFATVQVNNNNLDVTAVNYGIALHPALLASAGSAQVDGECNWWGAPNGPGPVGPGAGSRVTPNVDFAPWLIAPAPGGSCIGGNVATNKDQCKNGGWQTRVRSDGSTFKNQGDCIQYVNTGK